jgi:UMF1 family MFS transporter
MASLMSVHFTAEERRWIGYDVGNSALVMLNTSVVPIYFNSLLTGSDSDQLVVLWGLAQTVASLVVAILMPVLGSIADRKDTKIIFFTGSLSRGYIGCLALATSLFRHPCS